MGKHRSAAQEKVFIDFMESHQDIARGFVKGDRVITEALWSELTKNLNNSGPPSKDCNGWKKTWADWKMYIKKKMSHNKKENEKTGGGEYNKYVLTNIEESVARLTGIHRSVEGIAGAKSFGVLDLGDSEKENEDELDVTPSTSHAKRIENVDVSAGTNNAELKDSSNSSVLKRRHTQTPSPDPKRSRPRTPCTPRTPSKPDLNKLLEDENNHLKSIATLMEEQRVGHKLDKIVYFIKEQRDEIRLQNEKLDRLCNILQTHFMASEANDVETQKLLREKNELKLKVVEIETLRLELDKLKAKLP